MFLLVPAHPGSPGQRAIKRLLLLLSLSLSSSPPPSSSVDRSVTVMSPVKTAEPIEMPFGLRTWVDPGNHVLDGGQDPPWDWAIFWGRRERGIRL